MQAKLIVGVISLKDVYSHHKRSTELKGSRTSIDQRRFVLDDQYTGSRGTKFAIRWAPPEVLKSHRFSSKSDVWAYGVFMWEVFTWGKIPYDGLSETEVINSVQWGTILEEPNACIKEVYDVMRNCWSYCPDDRPSFRHLKELLRCMISGLAQ